MTGKIYFQWQNEFLRKTIYPLRERKLRDFLLYYKEIDLWREYQNKQVKDLPREVEELVAAENKAIAEMHKSEKEERDYFCSSEVPLFSDAQDDDEVKNLHDSLTKLHQNFQTYFAVYKNQFDKAQDKEKDQKEKSLDRNEKIYITMRIAEWETKQKELRHKITRKTNLLTAVQDEDRREEKSSELRVLEGSVLPRLEEELARLRAFASAKNRLVERKEEFDQIQKENKKKLDKIPTRLEQVEKDIRSLEDRKISTSREVIRLTAALKLDEFLRQWSSVNIYDEIRQAFTRGRLPVQNFVVDILVETIRAAIEKAGGGFDKDLGLKLQQWIEEGREHPQQIVSRINEQAAKFNQAQKGLEEQVIALEARAETMPVGSPNRMNQLLARNILGGPALKSVLAREADRLEDLSAAITYSRDNPAILQARLGREQASLAATEKDLQKKNAEAIRLNDELMSAIAGLRVSREKFVTEYVSRNGEISVEKDIVPYKARQYYAELEDLSHDQLLRRVYDRFNNQPERFPLWLQYMVIHFSGMRYASAHGSWADPRELLLSLSMLRIQNEHKALTENDINTQCTGKRLIYDPALKGTRGARDGAFLPALARAANNGSTDPAKPNPIRERIEYYLGRLDTQQSLDTRRKALLDLKIEEANHEIRAMQSEDILEQLKVLKDKLNLPNSMWNEIVKLTDLRLTEVDRQDWETFKPEDQEKRVAGTESKLAKYREILNDWKKENLTGWREEHERSNRLIVTRAVCNEVAEHIQHLRGHKAAGGLAEKPFWYKNAQSKFYETKPRPAEQPPYFVRAKDRNDFEVGASILWLRFVHDVPNQWREARPVETRRGEGLIAGEYLGRKRESGGWVYTLSQPMSRMRQKISTNKKGGKPGGKETQYLRWMHEATVAAVEETAEGTVVLTFETALPYDDPSMATVGVFKRYLSDLTGDLGEDAYNPAFVGFVPERALPPDEWEGIEEMLDWNHILMDDVMSSAELEEYRDKYIRRWKAPRPTIQIVYADAAEAKKGKADLPICEFVQWTDDLARKNENLYKVRIWGDPRLVGLNVQTVGMGNFQAVGLYNIETGRGAVSNFLKIHREDIDHLMAMQIEDEYVDKRKGKGDWRRQKMDWLCKGEGTIFFTKGGKGWPTAKSILWGTVALGGNLVQVEGEEDIVFKIGRQKVKMTMARLVGFRKWDWNKPLDELLAQGLVHRCFCASNRGRMKNKPIDTPKGIIYSPFLSALDWDFAGREQPRAFYLPMDQLVKPDEKDYDGIAKRLNCGA